MGNLLSEIHLNVHSETHRFALGSQILIDCLLLDVIHKYRYSNYLDYNAYHTWLHTNLLLLEKSMRSTVSQIRRKIVQVYERMSEWQLYITRI